LASGTKRYSVIVEMATKGARRTKESISGVGGASHKAAGGVGALTSKFGALGAAAGALGLGIVVKQLGDVYAASVGLYSEQIRQERQVAAAIESTGKAAGLSLAQIKGMASEIQGMTTFGDEAVLGMQSLLLTFKEIQGPEFKRTSMAVADMAVRMGGDDPASLKNAALQVGKALNDPVANLGALGRAGIQFSEDQQKVIKELWAAGEAAEAQRIMLAELESQFGGSAAALTGDAVGAWKQAKNVWGDLLEELGSTSVILVPVIRAMSTFLNHMVTGFRTMKVGVFGILAVLAERLGEFSADWQEMMAGLVDNRLGRLLGLGGVAEQLREAADESRKLGQQIGTNLRREAERSWNDITAGLTDVEVNIRPVTRWRISERRILRRLWRRRLWQQS